MKEIDGKKIWKSVDITMSSLSQWMGIFFILFENNKILPSYFVSHRKQKMITNSSIVCIWLLTFWASDQTIWDKTIEINREKCKQKHSVFALTNKCSSVYDCSSTKHVWMQKYFRLFGSFFDGKTKCNAIEININITFASFRASHFSSIYSFYTVHSFKAFSKWTVNRVVWRRWQLCVTKCQHQWQFEQIDSIAN